jgi:hypothetical protein
VQAGKQQYLSPNMKILRAVLYILGILLILLNIVSLITSEKTHMPKETAERVGYYLGFCLFFLPGIVFILIARSISKKIRRKKEQQLVNSLPE